MTPEYREIRIECSLRYLEEVRDLAVKHRANAEYIKSLEEDARGVGGIDYSRVMVSTSPTPDAIPNSVALLVEMKAEANVTSRSLRKYKELFGEQTKLRLRFSLENLRLDGDVLNIPLFMADEAGRLIGLAMEH